MTVTVMSSKGQVVIPAELRRQADLEAGDRIEVDFDAATQELRLRKAESVREQIDQLTAMVEPWIKPGTVPLIDPRAFYNTREPKR